VNSFSYVYWLIIACEVAFWVALALALAARYLLRRERLSRGLLLSLPGIDLVLLAFTAMDLKAGTPGDFAHGLATAYVGFTVAFGPIAVRWADARFAQRFAGGPAPEKAPDRGWAAVRYECNLWFRSIVAWIITIVLLSVLIAWIDDETITANLMNWYRIAFGSVVLWFVFGPLWSLVFFRGEKKAG
jgi:hypothetical protein